MSLSDKRVMRRESERKPGGREGGKDVSSLMLSEESEIAMG